MPTPPSRQLSAPPTAPPPPAPTGLWARVGVLTPHGRVDLALPSDVPVAELVPMVLELVAGPAADRDGVPRAWRFSGPAGGMLAPEATLAGLGVLDGELLHLGPSRAAPPAPVFDDPADALAASVRQAGDDGTAARWAGPLAALVVACAAAVLLASVHGSSTAAVVVAAGLAVLGAAAALGCARTPVPVPFPGEPVATDRPARLSAQTGRAAPRVDTDTAHRDHAQAAALAAVPCAAAAGLLLLPGTLGAGHVLLAAAAGGLAAVCGQAILRVVSAPLLGTAVGALAVVGAAVARLALDAPVPAVAAGLTALALATGPLLPRVALRLAGVPDPVVPEDLDGIARADTPALPGPEMAERAALARGLFAGLSAPIALLAAGGAVVAAAGGGWAGPVLAAVVAAVLLLRARAFAEAGPARVLGAAAVLATVGAAVPAALVHGPVVRLAVAAGLGVVVLVAARTAGRTPSPVGRRASDVLELVLTAAAIPAALATMGLFSLVRAL